MLLHHSYKNPSFKKFLTVEHGHFKKLIKQCLKKKSTGVSKLLSIGIDWTSFSFEKWTGKLRCRLCLPTSQKRIPGSLYNVPLSCINSKETKNEILRLPLEEKFKVVKEF